MIPTYGQASIDACNELKARGLELARELQWGTYGPTGSEPLEKVRIIDMSTSHIENVLISQGFIHPNIKAAMLSVLKERR